MLIKLINRSIVYSVLNRIITVICGVLSIYFINKYLDKEELGYYYLINSILGIQIIFEGGFSTALIIFYSKNKDSTEIINNKLFSIFHYAFNWYIKTALIFLITVSIGGFLFINLKSNSSMWVYPWFISISLVSISFLIIPFSTLLESLGNMGEIQKIRSLFLLIGSLFSWFLLDIGLGLYCLLGILLTNLIRDIYIAKKYIYLIKELIASRIIKFNNIQFNELKEFKFKLSISNLSMYFGFNLFIPVIYYFYNTETAGKMGVTWSALSSIQSVGVVILYTKYPRLAELIHKKFYLEARNEWIKISFLSTSLVVIAILLFNILFYLFEIYNFDIINKFLNNYEILILSLGMISLQVINCLNISIRSFGKELLMHVNLFINIILGILVIFTGKYYSVTAVIYVFTLVLSFLAVPWEILILKKLWTEYVKG